MDRDYGVQKMGPTKIEGFVVRPARLELAAF
jgi:hypothetical protein